MNKMIVSLGIAAAVAPLCAQSPPNLILANNEPYVQISTATHLGTGIAYNDPANNPVGYSTGAGVAANTWVWRVFPERTNVMREPRLVNGFQTIWRASAATPTGSSVRVYAPAIRLLNAQQRPGAPTGALDPDFSNPLVSVPENLQSYTFTTDDRLLAWTVTLATPVALTISGDHAIAAAYHGGDEQGRPATATDPSQSVLGSVQDGSVWDRGSPRAPFHPDGFAVVDPATQQATLTYKALDNSRTWLTYGTANPSINVITEWGRRRVQTVPPNAPLVGLSDGSYFADIGGSASPGGWALEVWADPAFFGGGLAVPFINIGSYFPGAIPVPLGALGTPVLELLPSDPTFSFLVSNIAMVLGPADGIGRTPSIPTTAPLPGLIGLYLGFEAAVIDPGLTTLTTTQARWVQIVL